MTVVSNDPALWPLINLFYVNSCCAVPSLCVMIYDCTLTFGQELDLIWSQQWSLMTVLYLIVRYIGIPLYAINFFTSLLTVSLTDAVSNVHDACHSLTTLLLRGNILSIVSGWMSLVANTTLEVIIITRLYAMYYGSKKMLVFLIAIFFPITILCIALVAVETRRSSMEEIILSGTYQCIQEGASTAHLLAYTWVVGIIWEVIALSLAIWSAIKHFRQRLGGWNVDDCFAVLIKSHVFYFASFLVVSCVSLGMGFQSLAFANSAGGVICMNIVTFMASVQISVLGPRLILGVRQNHAKAAAGFEEATALASIAFRQRSRTSVDGV